ncbi:MAG TPA: MFS transporter permease [Oscillatoriaceae cyanobacterium M33_DOE_052]|uniref:MFS transporter permease n=1 Tax=Planktothricoides sp. SpSt-374 TaxID=2282167 RepID=A0A7C3ZQD4_9CYAN|nr:MFS transporter permease [Oscillatoriaceae cyanobacterium M33_DOE_052]
MAKVTKFIGGLIAAGLGVVILMFSQQLFIVYAVVAAIALVLFLVIAKKPKAQSFVVPRSQLSGWINRWNSLNRTVAKMLPPPRQEEEGAPVSEELKDYSFDRLVVCDRPEIAQMLIANNFHFENNCAILSFNGYPQSIFTTVLEMLRRNPDLKVYALHDATPRGVSLVYHLQTSPTWFCTSNVAIYDLGLLPRQIMKNSQIFLQKSTESAAEAQQLPAPVKEKLSPAEITWLEAGNYVVLDVFSPRKLLQVVSQGIIKSRDMLPGDGSGSIIDGEGTAWTFTTGVGVLLADDNFG